MQETPHERAIFVNCPFDKDYAPLLEATIFCCVYLGFHPQLASVRLEAGEIRIEKIIGLIKRSRFSIHDLSRCKARKRGEPFRMNMPFEFGVDFGLRQSGLAKYGRKKFLIFEKSRFDLKSALSDIAGQDVDHHDDDFEVIIGKIRNFLKVEAEINAPGPQRIVSEYVTFQAWLMEKKIGEGHSEQQAIDLPTQERIQEMQVWINAGKPNPIINQ